VVVATRGRSLGHGYADIDNEFYTDPRTVVTAEIGGRKSRAGGTFTADFRAGAARR